MEATLKSIKNLFTSNFATLSPRIYDLNAATLKVNASFEYEGEFTEPELIVNTFNNELAILKSEKWRTTFVSTSETLLGTLTPLHTYPHIDTGYIKVQPKSLMYPLSIFSIVKNQSILKF